MADLIDLAQAHEQRLRERAVAQALAAARVGGAGSDVCHSCGEPIPAEWRRAVPHALTCTSCQARLERAYARGASIVTAGGKAAGGGR